MDDQSVARLGNRPPSATGETPFYDIAVYHCQQVAEKAVKAFLVHHAKMSGDVFSSISQSQFST